MILHHNPISDIAWAPAMGRSYHVIAVASRETKIKVRNLFWGMFYRTDRSD